MSEGYKEEGDKGRRKESRHKEEMEGKKDESGKYIWQYSEFYCCQRSSGSIPKNLLPLELHSLVSPVSAQELDWSIGCRKIPAFPRAAPLPKAAVLSLNQPSRSRWTQNHRGLQQTDCCLCGCSGKLWQHWNTATPKVQHLIHGPHSLCMPRLGKVAPCTGREHKVCTVSKTLPNHKKNYLDSFYVKKGGGYPPVMHKVQLSWV